MGVLTEQVTTEDISILLSCASHKVRYNPRANP